MLPYFEWKTIKLGFLTLYVWGVFVALGALAGLFISRRAARRRGLDPEKITEAVLWIIVAGFIGARLGHIFFYDPAPYLADPLEIFRLWHGGLSSIGGFIGALVAILVYRPRLKMPGFEFSDALARGFPAAWAIGRVGCFMIHDHPGVLSNNPLAVAYPGGARFDLGLIESLTAVVVGILMLLTTRLFPRRGVATATVVVSYLAIRFATDFLRARDLPGSDIRYFSNLLTPSQIGAIAALAAMAVLIPWAYKKGKAFRTASHVARERRG